jgi:Zn-dependent membrane protease YugP
VQTEKNQLKKCKENEKKNEERFLSKHTMTPVSCQLVSLRQLINAFS